MPYYDHSKRWKSRYEGLMVLYRKGLRKEKRTMSIMSKCQFEYRSTGSTDPQVLGYALI